MPFKAEKQRRYMHANLPEIAKRWERDYASGGIARLGFANGNEVLSPYLNQMPQNIIQSMRGIPRYGLGVHTTHGYDPAFGMLTSQNRYDKDMLPIGSTEYQYDANKEIPGLRYPGMQQNNMISNMQRMKPLALDIMTGKYKYGVGPDGKPYQEPRTIADQNKYLGQTFTQRQPVWYNRMFNKVGEGITGIKNRGGALAGNIMGLLSGIPGLGMLLGSMRPDNPYEKFQKQMFSEMGYQGDPNKDPFGKNIRSLFGNYDVVEQFDKLAGSKLGQKYGYAEAMADGVLTDEEIEAMQDIDPLTGKPRGLKGWQLNRFKTLFEAKKRAMNWYDRTKRPPGLDTTTGGISKKIFKQPTSTGGGGSPTQMAKDRIRQRDLSGSNQKSFGPYQDRASSAAATRSKDLGSMRGGVGRGRSHHFAQGGIAGLWPR